MNKQTKTRLLQVSLFLITLVTTTLAGAEWTIRKFLILGMSWDDFLFGFRFSIPFLAVLTVHEFGHYFTARYHQVGVSLPYYIPMWFGFLGVPTLGTMGAFIRIKEQVASRIKYFDIGVSGPIAGFLVAIILLIWGFRTLPETTYIFEIHPEYEIFGASFEDKMYGLDTVIYKKDLNPSRQAFDMLPDTISISSKGSIYFGDNLLMNIGRKYIAPTDRYVPSDKEIMHYPLLLAAFLAFFFTALNLLPIGQLDGGHVLFGMFGPKYHALVSRILFGFFVFYAGLGWITVTDLADNGSDALFSSILKILTYLFILYLSAYSMYKNKRDRLLYATLLFTAQFLISSFFDWEGYSGWLLFAVLIGRFMGVDHPPVMDQRPLSTSRKIIGWIALVIFILSFSPQPLVISGL